MYVRMYVCMEESTHLLAPLRGFDGRGSVPAISHHPSRTSDHMGISILHTYIHNHVIKRWIYMKYVHTTTLHTSPSYAPTDGSFPNCCCCSIVGPDGIQKILRMYVCIL